MVLDLDQSQRRDIDETLNDRLTLAIDEENIADNPYIFKPTSFTGINWYKQGDKIVKDNIVENDSLSFSVSAIESLVQKDITNIIVSFDYTITNISLNHPILSNIGLTCMGVTNYFSVENVLNTQGHIDVSCSLFDFSSSVINSSISEQGFTIGLNFNGNKSNVNVKLSNVTIKFEYQNKLQDEIDAVNNRVSSNFDFFVEDEDLIVSFNGVERDAEVPVEHINIKDIANLIYPVGSIYMSTNSVSPSILFGGEWEQIYDCFLLASGYSHLNGETGGSEDAVIVSHNHTQNAHTHTQNAHSHGTKYDDNSYVVSENTSGASNKRVTAVSSGSTYVDTSSTANFHHYNATESIIATNQNTTATNNATGESGTGKNMPPYLTVNVWKRIK